MPRYGRSLIKQPIVRLKIDEKKEPKEYILEKIGQGPIDWKILVGKLIAGKWLFHFDAGTENRIQK